MAQFPSPLSASIPTGSVPPPAPNNPAQTAPTAPPKETQAAQTHPSSDQNQTQPGSSGSAQACFALWDNHGAHGSKVFEALAGENDCSNQLIAHFGKIYSGRAPQREADLDRLVQRLQISDPKQQHQIKDQIQWMFEHKMLVPMPAEIGKAELFFRRFGATQSTQMMQRLQDLVEKPKSRLDNKQRRKLAESLFRDLAVPSAIGQGGKGSCAAASVQVMLASADPQYYLNTALKLAEGQNACLPDNTPLAPNDDWLHNEDRQLSEAVMQNALMDLMLGKGQYHSNLDDGKSQTAPKAGQQRHALERLAPGSDYDDTPVILAWPLSWATESEGMTQLEDELARGRPVLVNIWGHAMCVTGMDKTGPEPKVLVSTYEAQIEMPASKLEGYLTHSITRDDPGRDNRKIPQGQRVVIGTDLGRLPD